MRYLLHQCKSLPTINSLLCIFVILIWYMCVLFVEMLELSCVTKSPSFCIFMNCDVHGYEPTRRKPIYRPALHKEVLRNSFFIQSIFCPSYRSIVNQNSTEFGIILQYQKAPTDRKSPTRLTSGYESGGPMNYIFITLVIKKILHYRT